MVYSALHGFFLDYISCFELQFVREGLAMGNSVLEVFIIKSIIIIKRVFKLSNKNIYIVTSYKFFSPQKSLYLLLHTYKPNKCYLS